MIARRIASLPSSPTLSLDTVLFQKLLQKRITIVPTEDPRGAQAQLLACTSKILPSLFPHDIPMERAINDLAPYAEAGY